MQANTNGNSNGIAGGMGGAFRRGIPYALPTGKPEFNPHGGNPIREMQKDAIRQKAAERYAERNTATLSSGAAKELLGDAQRNLGRIVGKLVGSLSK